MFARLAKAAYKINFVMSYMLSSEIERSLNVFDLHELESARDILDEIIQKHSEGKQH